MTRGVDVIVGVIAQVAAGDPGRLLARGVCGPMPAYAWNPHGRGWQTGTAAMVPGWPCEGLPLWWDGRLVPEGWDRAIRAMSFVVFETDDAMKRRVAGHPERSLNPFAISHWRRTPEPPLDEVERAADFLRRLGFASRVVRVVREGDRLVEVVGSHVAP